MKMTAHDLAACLWFHTQAEEAVNFYVSIFENARVGGISRYGLVTAVASTRQQKEQSHGRYHC